MVSAAILSSTPVAIRSLHVAARYAIPAIYEQRQLVAAGGLVSYRKLQQAKAIAFVIIGTGTEPCLSCSLHGGQSRSPPLLRGNRGDQPRVPRLRQLPRP